MSSYEIDVDGIPFIEKSPGAELDYTFAFDDWLTPLADVITSAVVAVPTGLIKLSQSIDATNKRVSVWIKSGTLNSTYDIVCTITTAAARVDVRTIRIKIVNR
jgi:hypothetical protein